MTEETVKNIYLIFQIEVTYVRILKYSCPGVSHFERKDSGKPIIQLTQQIPGCLISHPSIDFMKVGYLPHGANNNLRMIYLAILIMAFEDPSMRLLKKIKSLAYNYNKPLIYFPRHSVPEQFRSFYEDRQFRKLFVEFFHLVGSKKSANKVLRFIEKYPIIDLAFTLLFKLVATYDMRLNGELVRFYQHLYTAHLIETIWKKLDMRPNFIEGKLQISQHRFITEDPQNIYMTYHQQDDLNLDTSKYDSSSEESDEESYTAFKGKSLKYSHIDSSQTKVTEYYFFSNDRTPIKNEVSPNVPLLAQSMMPSTKPKQYYTRASMFFKMPIKGQDFKESQPSDVESKLYSSRAYVTNQEYEIKCYQVNGKLRRMDSNAYVYTTSSQYSSSKLKNDTSMTATMRVFPIVIKDKERQTYRKPTSEYFDTSFCWEKPSTSGNISSVGSPNPNVYSNNTSVGRLLSPSVTSFVKSSELPPRSNVIRFEHNKSTSRYIYSANIEPAFVRTSSGTFEKATETIKTSRLSYNYNDPYISRCTSTGGGLLLKEKPKQISIKKI